MLVHLSLLTFAGLVCVNGAPTVQLGNATLVGFAIPSFGQDFFGGSACKSSPSRNPANRPLKEFLSRNRLLEVSAFNLRYC